MNEIIEAIKQAAVRIDSAIKELDESKQGSINASGEEQLALDVKSDGIIEEELSKLSSVKAVVSEEKADIKPLSESGSLTVCYDPLDGSSLVDVNLSVGSIFGIYEDVLEGANIKAAAYVVYGPRLEMVTVQRDEVPMLWRYNGNEFVKIKTIALGQKGKLNAPGATQKGWSKAHNSLIEALFSEGYRLRYSGGMVPDLHQILLKGGGLFSYPGTTDKPKGKLRQLFEVIPFALVYTAAGGEAVDDRSRPLLGLKPASLHDTTPCFFGSRYEIEKLREYYGLT